MNDMENTILHGIFKGKILPWEDKLIKSPKYKALQEKIRVEREQLEENMSLQEKKKFEQYHVLLQEREFEERENAEYELFMLGITAGTEIAEFKKEWQEQLKE